MPLNMFFGHSDKIRRGYGDPRDELAVHGCFPRNFPSEAEAGIILPPLLEGELLCYPMCVQKGNEYSPTKGMCQDVVWRNIEYRWDEPPVW